ncbi:M10 family metallopeptidase C-terminal domain-containing protein, partial [Inquilinus sp. CA228]|uniref:M10 family metallopeptidase C-terminal domain-containing protein n=1 Tax=Inquilinus sp. CA228 TaxID=3455609 RepID=UPI003F8D0E64
MDFIGDDSGNIIDGTGNTDLIIGRGGNDTLTGGGGSDTFRYDTREFDADTITDFTLGVDKIDLSFLKVSDLASLTPFMEQSGDDTVIRLGYDSDDEVIILKNVNKDSLTAGNFVFYTAATAVTATGTGYNDFLFGGSVNDTLSGGDGY